MSLSFFSKKSWHTTNLQNVEKVWLAEQAEKKEAEKLDQWKKEREEERQIEQLRQLQRETGQAHARQGPERVDWLYEQPTTSGTEYLMGKAMEVKPEESEVKQVEHMPGSTFLNGQNNLSNAANEEFNKMTNDPLVAMRAAEQKALQAIINNPVKMKQIRQQAGGGSARKRSQVSKTNLLPFVSSSPIERMPMRGVSTPKAARTYSAPITAY